MCLPLSTSKGTDAKSVMQCRRFFEGEVYLNKYMG